MSEELSIRKDNIGDFYDIGEEIGSGQFAVVKKLLEKSSGETFAAKFIKKRRSKALKRGMTQEQFMREADVLRSVDHIGIIYLHDIFETKLEFVLVLELLSGGELFEFLSEQEFLTEDEAVGFLKQVIEAIDYLHSKSIAHLDIKPENLVLKEEGSPHIKLIDFGLARKLSKGEMVREIMGTPEFVAPEIIAFEAVGTETDMWLSGASPFLGDDVNETFSNISMVDYEFDDEYFKDISLHAKDFISSLLVKDTRERMSADQCLKHDWMQELDDQGSINSSEDDDVCDSLNYQPPSHKSEIKKRRSTMIKTDAFKAFTARARWQKSLSKVIAISRLALLGKKNGPLQRNSPDTESDTNNPSLKTQITSDDTNGDYNKDKIKDDINGDYSKDKIKDDINGDYSKDKIKDDINGDYSKDKIKDDSNGDYSKDKIKDDINGDYNKDKIKDDSNGRDYKKDSIKDDRNGDYKKDTIEDFAKHEERSMKMEFENFTEKHKETHESFSKGHISEKDNSLVEGVGQENGNHTAKLENLGKTTEEKKNEILESDGIVSEDSTSYVKSEDGKYLEENTKVEPLAIEEKGSKKQDLPVYEQVKPVHPVTSTFMKTKEREIQSSTMSSSREHAHVKPDRASKTDQRHEANELNGAKHGRGTPPSRSSSSRESKWTIGEQPRASSRTSKTEHTSDRHAPRDAGPPPAGRHSIDTSETRVVSRNTRDLTNKIDTIDTIDRQETARDMESTSKRSPLSRVDGGANGEPQEDVHSAVIDEEHIFVIGTPLQSQESGKFKLETQSVAHNTARSKTPRKVGVVEIPMVEIPMVENPMVESPVVENPMVEIAMVENPMVEIPMTKPSVGVENEQNGANEVPKRTGERRKVQSLIKLDEPDETVDFPQYALTLQSHRCS
ncbi:hypothetical protein QZH41_012351 [Actinostola sp. cb2023]|nr:hypothetical protein QZH41_012351 [Actinostola sp. cb2023]